MSSTTCAQTVPCSCSALEEHPGYSATSSIGLAVACGRYAVPRPLAYGPTPGPFFWSFGPQGKIGGHAVEMIPDFSAENFRLLETSISREPRSD